MSARRRSTIRATKLRTLAAPLNQFPLHDDARPEVKFLETRESHRSRDTLGLKRLEGLQQRLGIRAELMHIVVGGAGNAQ